MLCSHAIIVYSRCRIPNLHLIMCTCYLMVLFFYLAGYTFHFVLLKRHLKAALHFILFSVQILFICILSIRILFFSFAYFFHSYTLHLCPFFHPSTFNSYTLQHTCFPVSIAEFSRICHLQRTASDSYFIHVISNNSDFIHFIHTMSNDTGIVTKLPETFSLFLVKSKYRLTLTQGFC